MRAALVLVLMGGLMGVLCVACLSDRALLLAGKACDEEGACADGYVCRDDLCIPQAQAAAQDPPDAGSDPSDAGVIIDAGPSCVESARRCAGNTPQVCTGGEYLDENPCPNVCVDGVCAGSCAPGDTVCVGRERFVCDEHGSYPATGTQCEFACASGECVGSCVPDTRRCDALVPETCDAAGAYVAGAACGSFCLDGACVDCEPGTKRCNGVQLETCSQTGAYDDIETCDYICDAAVPACAGTCTPGFEACAGTVLQQCPGGTLTETPCTFVCNPSTFQCDGECVPDAVGCSGDTPTLCGDDGYFASLAPCNGGTPFCDDGGCVAAVLEGFPNAFTRDAPISAHYLIARRIPLTTGTRAVKAGIDVRAGAGSHMVAGVYTDAGGIPGNLLAATASTVTVLGAQEIPLASEANLSGAAVWLVVTFDASTSVGWADLGVTDTLFYAARTYDGALPANFASGGSLSSERYNLWIVARP